MSAKQTTNTSVPPEPKRNPEPAPSLYQPPKTSLFLEAGDIKGGNTNVPESNAGLLS